MEKYIQGLVLTFKILKLPDILVNQQIVYIPIRN